MMTRSCGTSLCTPAEKSAKKRCGSNFSCSDRPNAATQARRSAGGDSVGADVLPIGSPASWTGLQQLAAHRTPPTFRVSWPPSGFTLNGKTLERLLTGARVSYDMWLHCDVWPCDR